MIENKDSPRCVESELQTNFEDKRRRMRGMLPLPGMQIWMLSTNWGNQPGSQRDGNLSSDEITISFSFPPVARRSRTTPGRLCLPWPDSGLTRPDCLRAASTASIEKKPLTFPVVFVSGSGSGLSLDFVRCLSRPPGSHGGAGFVGLAPLSLVTRTSG